MEDLQNMLQYYKAGTEVTLTVQRQDGNGSYKEATVKVTLGTRESIESQDSQNSQNQQGGQGQSGRPGNQEQQGGQDEQNGYNNQSGSDESSQQNQGYSNPFEQFGFPFGF